MKTIILLFLIFGTMEAMANNIIGNQGIPRHFDFGGIIYPTNYNISGTHKTLYFDCDGAAESTALHNGEDYIVPSGKTYTPIGITATTDTAAAPIKLGYCTGSVVDGQAFGTCTGGKYLDSGALSTDYDFQLQVAGKHSFPFYGPHQTFPAGARPICYNGLGAKIYVKMYGTEQ